MKTFVITFLLILIILPTACTPPPLDDLHTGDTPTSTPPPTPISTPFAGVREDPQRLTLIQTDLPAGFRKLDNITMHEGHNAVLFMNEEAVKGQGEQVVLGVVDEITTYENDADARYAFENDLLLTEQDIAKKIQESDSATPDSINVQVYNPDLSGADLLRAFKASYKLGDTTVNEYRYQFLVSNAIGNVIVTVRADADGEESESGRAQADAIAQAQIDKLNDYRVNRPE